MDIQLIQRALEGLVPIEELTIPERMALLQMEVLRYTVTPKQAPLQRFLVPAGMERHFRGG